MFSNYSDVFCLHPNDMGHTTEVKHHIDTGDSPPIHQPPRRIPHARRLEVKKLLEDMLKKDVIRPSNSPLSFWYRRRMGKQDSALIIER